MILAYFSKIAIFEIFPAGKFAGIEFFLENCYSSKFLKIFKIFLRKIVKMHYFSIFSKNVINDAFIFRAFGRKTQFVGNF